MVSNINNIEQSTFQPKISQRQLPTIDMPSDSPSDSPSESLASFDIEDKAIISSEAKLQNESEKFNSGEGNAIDLAVTQVTTKAEVSAEVNVIKTKKDMLDATLNIGK